VAFRKTVQLDDGNKKAAFDYTGLTVQALAALYVIAAIANQENEVRPQISKEIFKIRFKCKSLYF
jgi:hypothetical protein